MLKRCPSLGCVRELLPRSAPLKAAHIAQYVFPGGLAPAWLPDRAPATEVIARSQKVCGKFSVVMSITAHNYPPVFLMCHVPHWISGTIKRASVMVAA